MSLFDSSILSQSLDANATRREPLPAGETYAQITKVEPDSGIGKNDRPWYKLNVTLDIQDPDYLSTAQRSQAMLTYGIMLDMTEQGTLSMAPNSNIRLGRLRAATGTNQPGKTLNDMVGQMVRVTIGHRPDPNDPEVVYDEVKGVAKYA